MGETQAGAHKRPTSCMGGLVLGIVPAYMLPFVSPLPGKQQSAVHWTAYFNQRNPTHPAPPANVPSPTPGPLSRTEPGDGTDWAGSPDTHLFLKGLNSVLCWNEGGCHRLGN